MPRISPLTKASLQHGPRRYVTVAIAIVLGVAFLTASLAVGASMEKSVSSTTEKELAPYAASVSGGPSLDQQVVRRVAGLDGVTGVDPQLETSLSVQHGSARPGFAVGHTPPLGAVSAKEGSTTARQGQVLISTDMAAVLRAHPGDVVTLSSDGTRPLRRTVAGVISSTGPAVPTVFASGPDLLAVTGASGYDSLLVRSSVPDDVVARLSDQLGSALTVRSQADEVAHQVDEKVSGLSVITMFLSVFALIAVFVAAMVIANTFQILLAQRSRELALMRCVGAGRRQIRRAVRTEALVLGLSSSVVGVALGLGAVAALSAAFSGSETLPLQMALPSLPLLLLPIVLGTGVTLVAAAQPARRAAKVAPLEALRPEPACTGAANRRRVVVGTLVAAAGFAALATGAVVGQAQIAVPGGLLSFLGVVLTAPVLVPALARGVGKVGRPVLGVTGRLAVDNTTRNPRRTAATSTALLVGITLVSTMLVGAATTQKQIGNLVDQQMPVDAQVSSSSSISTSTENRLARIDGIADHARVRTGDLSLTHGDTTTRKSVVGVTDQVRAVVRDRGMTGQVRAGGIVLGKGLADELGARSGDTVTIGSRGFTAAVSDRDGDMALVSDADLRTVAPHAQAQQVWLRAADGADAAAVNDAVARVQSSQPDLQVSGSLSMRQEMESLIDLMLAVVTGLLAMAVVIALIGVANTLSLSVMERTRESAMLRAVGLTRRRLRRMIALESLLVALVAAALGIGLGVLYGWAGVHALLGSHADGVLLEIPWARVGLVVAVAAAAGLLAAVVPARRACRAAPVEALGAE